ncbi:MAG: sulfatase, partial [Candidatus Micrarchaeota archaeon]|nr:sulfatase [Candidatus Micrarchaeota archaeon]
RKDIIDLYGGEARMPNLRKLAKESMVYENAIAPSPWTYPSHVSLFTGMYLNEHGVHETFDAKLLGLNASHEKLAADRLAAHLGLLGYKTLGVSNNIMVSRFTGFDRGFGQFLSLESSPWLWDKYAIDAARLGSDVGQIAGRLIRKGKFGEMVRFGRTWLRIKYVSSVINYPLNKGAELTNNILYNSKLPNRLFLFLNFYELHEPYRSYTTKESWEIFTGMKEMPKSKIAYQKAQYISGAEYLDSQLGKLFETLRERGMYDSSMIIVTSDHGQAFNEHGFMYHGTYLYDELTRVPLIIKYPDGKRFPKRKGYQSLTSIFNMINDVVRGGDDRRLTTTAAFAESYGTQELLPKKYERRRAYVTERYEKLRTAVFKDGFKLTLNGTDGTVEEFLHGKSELDPDRAGNKRKLRELCGEIRKFKKGREFVLPEL